MWKFDQIPPVSGACTIIAPDGAEIAAIKHGGLAIKQGTLLVSFEGVAAGDGGKGKRGFLTVPLEDFHPSDQRILRDRVIAAVS